MVDRIEGGWTIDAELRTRVAALERSNKAIKSLLRRMWWAMIGLLALVVVLVGRIAGAY